jgi:hypothetical protein
LTPGDRHRQRSVLEVEGIGFEGRLTRDDVPPRRSSIDGPRDLGSKRGMGKRTGMEERKGNK